jgi:hypothetical protein
VVAEAVVAGDPTGEVADLAGERVHRRVCGGGHEGRRHRCQLGALVVVEPVRGAGDRIAVTG